MTHVFISYSSQNQDYARRVEGDLLARGFDVWIDDRIDYGDRWWLTIVEAVQACAALIVIMSPEAEASEWVEREILLAQREGKPIFPLLLRGHEFPLLITTQFADVTYDEGAEPPLPPDDFYDRLAEVAPPQVDQAGESVAPPPPTFSTRPMPLDQAQLAERMVEQARTGPPPEPVDRSGAPLPPPESSTGGGRGRGLLVIGAVVIIALVAAVALMSPGGAGDATPTGDNTGETATTPPDDTTPDAPTGPPSAATAETALDTALAAAWAGVTANDEWTPVIEPVNGVPMALVPAGSFELGRSGAGVYADETPATEWTIEAPFWIDQTEVTWGMYADCLDAEGSPCSTDVPARAPGWAANTQQPVSFITWEEALAYCQWRGGKLPTEVQWEYAASGPDDLLYPWGDTLNTSYAIMRQSDEAPATRPQSISLARRDRSWVGALDMAGNVAEWTYTLYLPYDDPGYVDGLADTSNTSDLRVTRGGAYSYAGDVHTAYRHELRPVNHLGDFGVRCVVEIGAE